MPLEIQTSVAISDEDVKKRAIELGMVEKTWTPSVEELLKEMIEDDPDNILDSIDESEILDYISDRGIFDREWTDYIDDCDIEDYARDNLEMISLEDLPDYVYSNYSPNDLFESSDLMEAIGEDFIANWTEYVDEDDIIEYAKDHSDLMTKEEAIEYAKEVLSDFENDKSG